MTAQTVPSEKQVRIVVVEDNVEANNLLRDWLKPRFQVTCFYDAESTLRHLGGKPNEDRIVFLIDYNMPGDDGITLKRKLAEFFPQARYILVSGLFDEKLSTQARAAGFHALLPKPFGLPAVLQKIETIMENGASKEGLVGRVRRHIRETGYLPGPSNGETT